MRRFGSREEQAAAMIRLKGLPRFNRDTLRLALLAKGPQSFYQDLVQSHQRTGTITDEGLVRSWLSDSGSADIEGVDTPGAEYPSPRQRKQRASFTINPLHGRLYTVEINASTRRGISPRLKQSRDQQIEALQGMQRILRDGIALLEKQPSKEANRELREARRVLVNVENHLRAYKQGKLLIVGQVRDKALIDQYARLIRDSVELDPRSMDVAAIYVGPTQRPEAAGYTHGIHAPGKHRVTVPYIAINNRFYDLDQELYSPEARRRRLTMIHELVHVLRKHESGRTTKHTRHVEDYGKDLDKEEANTVLETQLRAGRQANRRDESYYAFIPDVPVEVGAEDNRRTRDAKQARSIKQLGRINAAMKDNAKRAHISRLSITRGKWGARNPEHVDRVLRTSDGDVVHLHNPSGLDGDVAGFVDDLDGDKGDGVWEYRDGRRRRG